MLTNQLLRAGTSIGANIHESKYAHGTADFIAKMQIALKECQESFRNISAPSPDPLPKPQFLRKAVGLNYGKKEYIINIAFVLPKYENSWYND